MTKKTEREKWRINVKKKQIYEKKRVKKRRKKDEKKKRFETLERKHVLGKEGEIEIAVGLTMHSDMVSGVIAVFRYVTSDTREYVNTLAKAYKLGHTVTGVISLIRLLDVSAT